MLGGVGTWRVAASQSQPLNDDHQIEERPSYGGLFLLCLVCTFDVRVWPIASFGCAAEFGRYAGIADIE
jgi:hypothetical protein